MAHTVTFTIPPRRLGRADIEFAVKKSGAKFGTLRVSKGSLVWIPVNKTYGFKMGWTQVAELAEQHGAKGHM